MSMNKLRIAGAALSASVAAAKFNDGPSSDNLKLEAKRIVDSGMNRIATGVPSPALASILGSRTPA